MSRNPGTYRLLPSKNTGITVDDEKISNLKNFICYDFLCSSAFPHFIVNATSFFLWFFVLFLVFFVVVEFLCSFIFYFFFFILPFLFLFSLILFFDFIVAISFCFIDASYCFTVVFFCVVAASNIDFFLFRCCFLLVCYCFLSFCCCCFLGFFIFFLSFYPALRKIHWYCLVIDGVKFFLRWVEYRKFMPSDYRRVSEAVLWTYSLKFLGHVIDFFIGYIYRKREKILNLKHY